MPTAAGPQPRRSESWTIDHGSLSTPCIALNRATPASSPCFRTCRWPRAPWGLVRRSPLFCRRGRGIGPQRLHQGPIAFDIGLVGGGIGHSDFCNDIHRRFRLRTEALHGHGTKSRASEHRKTPLIECFHGVFLWLSSPDGVCFIVMSFCPDKALLVRFSGSFAHTRGLSSNGTENWDRVSGVLRLYVRFYRAESA